MISANTTADGVRRPDSVVPLRPVWPGGAVRVLHVLGALDPGGVETWLLELLRRLDRQKWEWDFCTLGPTPGRYAWWARALGARVWNCPRRGEAGLPGFIRRFGRLLRQGRYQVIHSHVHSFSAVVLGAAYAAGVPVRVAHSHNTKDGCGEGGLRRAYRAVAGALLRRVQTAGLACSQPAAEALFGPLRANRRIHVVGYGVPAPAHPDPCLREELGFERQIPVAGHVGRFVPQKNQEFLLEVAAALTRRRPEVRWVFVGDGPLRGRIEQRAERMGLRGVVRFLGLREDVPRLFSSVMDVFVLPSLHEGLPVAWLEAQAAGLASLVSPAAPREGAVLRETVEFLPLEAGPEVWAEGVMRCLNRPRVPPQTAWRALAAGGFTAETSLDALLRAYAAAMEGVR